MKNFIIRFFRTVVNSWKDAFTLNVSIDKNEKKEVIKTILGSILLFIVIWASFKFVVSGNKPVAKSEPEIFVADTTELWYFNGMKDTVEIVRPINSWYELRYHRNFGYSLYIIKGGFFYTDFKNVINYKILNNGQIKK